MALHRYVAADNDVNLVTLKEYKLLGIHDLEVELLHQFTKSASRKSFEERKVA